MTCEHIRLPDGNGFRLRHAASAEMRPVRRRADLECDWKVPGRKRGTCDAPICSRCTTSPAPEKDLCPDHAAAWQRWKEARSA